MLARNARVILNSGRAISTNYSKCQQVSSSNTNPQHQEVKIPVPWGHIAGKWWGPTDVRPILSLHGWQDNCGTFDRLIPLLLRDDVGFLAIDLPGHGYSSRLPPGMYYDGINYTILVRYLTHYFQWPKVSLMGHSLGGITSFVYGLLYPDSVDFAICLDAAKPMVRSNNNLYIADSIDKFLKYNEFSQSAKEPPSYTLDEIRTRVCTPHRNSIRLDHCECLLERNIAPSTANPGKYYFTRDPRLKSGGLLNYAQHEIVEHSKRIKFPLLIAKATNASYYEPKENFYEVLDVLKKGNDRLEFGYVDGTHHVHLNEPEKLASWIGGFIDKYVGVRRDGGMKDEIRAVC